jgi:xanthine dehydrogenase iron-sulfur cluster and FAD-binding subunit A
MKDGAEVTTIEGLATDGAHVLQQAFIDRRVPVRLLHAGPDPLGRRPDRRGQGEERRRIRELMSGNICRCGAYPNIVAAIRRRWAAAINQHARAADVADAVRQITPIRQPNYRRRHQPDDLMKEDVERPRS